MAGNEVKTLFDPEGTDYDYDTASQYGIEPDETGHWQSRVPETGLILKGRNHPTFSKTIQGEIDEGYEIYKGSNGRYYSSSVVHDEASLNKANRPSLDELLFPDFDIKDVLSAEALLNRELLVDSVGNDEIDSQWAMSVLYDNVGITNSEQKNAHNAFLMALTGTDTPKKLWQAVQGSITNNFINDEIDDINRQKMSGNIKTDDADNRISKLESLKSVTNEEGFNKWLESIRLKSADETSDYWQAVGSLTPQQDALDVSMYLRNKRRRKNESFYADREKSLGQAITHGLSHGSMETLRAISAKARSTNMGFREPGELESSAIKQSVMEGTIPPPPIQEDYDDQRKFIEATREYYANPVVKLMSGYDDIMMQGFKKRALAGGIPGIAPGPLTRQTLNMVESIKTAGAAQLELAAMQALENHPEWTPYEAGTALEYLKDPVALIGQVSESTPFSLGAIGSNVAGGPVGSLTFTYAVESQNAKESAMDYFMEENNGKPFTVEQLEKARQIGDIYGGIAAAIEQAQVQHVINFWRGGKKAIMDKAVKSLVKKGIKITKESAKLAFAEAAEENLQNMAQELTGKKIADIPILAEGDGLVDYLQRIAKTSLIAGTSSLVHGFGGVVLNVTAENNKLALEKTELGQAEKGQVSPVTYISQIITSDITEHQKIESRLDIGKLGRVMVEPEAAYPGIMAGDMMAEEVTTQDTLDTQATGETFEQGWEAARRKYGTDKLTGLPKREIHEEDIQKIFSQADAGGNQVALIMIDVSNLKGGNDIAGHATGDAILKAFGSGILNNTREGRGDIFGARWGGDEFVLAAMLPPNATPQQANAIAKRVVDGINKNLTDAGMSSIEVGNNKFPIFAAAGVTMRQPGDKRSHADILAEADKESYRVKEARKKELGGTDIRKLTDAQVKALAQQYEKEQKGKPKVAAQETAKTTPQKKDKTKPVKEVKLTPEEEYQLIQSEATFAAEAPFEITPELYIGNMTQRAKNAIGDSFGVDPSQVRDFLDGAWPTKRTKITLRMDESRALLIHMEASLQDRVDNNKIHTEKDLWQANADWGDIKELRHKLGLPVIQCPFRVIRGGGTKTILIENTKERIEKTTKAGALDVVEMTRIKHLNDVMARVAKYAREGFAAGKKEAREAYALLQYLRKQKQMREALMDKITAEPGEGIHVAYRKAITDLQNAFDWEIRREEDKVKKEALKKQIEKNETLVNELPAKLLESLTKKDAIDLSYMDLLAVNDEINRLKQLGKLKSRAYHKLRSKALEKTGDEFADSVKKSRPRLSKKERLWNLRFPRIFDMIDGNKVKSYTGAIYNFFYNETNDNYNAELETSDARLKAGANRREELGIKLKDLTKKRTIEGIDARLTLDEMLTVYTGWMNPENRAALEFGGMEITGQKKPLKIDQAMYDKIFNTLTGNEKMLGDTILAEYAQNAYDRLRNTKIVAENKDMGNTENYTPMQRVGIVYDSIEAEVDGEFEFRKAFRQAMPEKGFTIDRRLVPPEYQTPIKSGLVKQWMQMVRKHEHYIANVQHIKDMRSLMKQDNFRKAIVDKFGEVGVETINHYIDGIANPDFYRNYNDMENLTRTMRKHAALAYIAYNLSSLAKQIPALASYWANSSIMDIVGSSINAAIHPMQSYERAKQIHYQVSHQSIEREMIELQRADANAYEKIIGKVGRTGMYGIFAIDRAIRVIGINAVYAKSKRNGMGELEARQAAAKVTLMTQEAASPKDLARIYSTNEFLNVFLMFTNQLNQIYNISTYDIPEAFRNGSYREAVRSTVSLAAMALMIWIIDNQEVPDEPEEFADAISDQFISSLPLVGGWINSSREGWKPSTPPQSMAYDTTQGIKKLYEGDVESGIKPLLRSTATGLGLPYVGAKEAYEFIEEQ